MGSNTLDQRLEDLIVDAFKKYEQGLWPVSMRNEARLIIQHSKVNLDKERQ